jgi:hypothetical protein
MGTRDEPKSWKEAVNVFFRMPGCSVNGVAELKLGRDSRRGSCYPWLRLRHLDKNEMVRAYYELQEKNSKVTAVTISLKTGKNLFGIYLLDTHKKNIRAMSNMVKFVCDKAHGGGGNSVVGINTCYWLDGMGIESLWGGEIFSARLDRPWSLLRLLYCTVGTGSLKR